MMLLFCTAVSVGNSVAQTYQKGSAGNPFQYTRASLTERVKVVMIGASSIQPNTGVGCAGVDEANNAYKGKVSYTTKTGGFTTNSAQGYSSADVTQSYFADYPFSCPSIAHAYLYWGGSAYAQNVNANYWNEKVYITRPDGSESGAISAQYYGSTEGFESERTGGSAASDDCMSYWAMADVTSVLAGQGIGTIGVRGVKADIDDSKGGAIAGWCLVLLFRDDMSNSYPETQFTLFDGAAFFKEGSSVNKALTFNAVTSGIISGSVGMAAMDGDVGSKTDQVTFTANGGATAQNLNDLRGTTDFFSSSMSYNGESMMHSENAAFGCGNTLGFDAHHIDLPKNSVTNSSNSATLKVSTNDTYMMPFMAYVAISSDVPSLVVSKVASSSSVAPGQNLKYFIALKNEGGKQTQNNTAYVEDVLDYNVTYVPNSVRITLSSNAAITDQAWANATYNAGTRTLRVNNLPSIPSEATLTITYQVQVAGADRGDLWRSTCMRDIWNTAEATYYDQDKPAIAKKASLGKVRYDPCGIDPIYNKVTVQADFETDYDMSAITHNVTEANGSVSLAAYLKSVLSAEIKNDTRSVANSEGLPVFSYYESNGTTLVSGNLNVATGQTKTYYAKRTLTTHSYKPACTEDVIEINLVRKECKLTAATFTATDVTCPGLTNGQIALTEIATAQDMAEGAKFDLISGIKNDPLAVTAADIISTHKTTTETGYTFGDLAAGDYSIMFTDGLGCKIIRNGTVKEPDPIVVELNDPAACVGNRLEFVATTTGGMEGTDYYYKWYRSADGTNYTEDTTQGDDNTYSVNSTGTRVYVKAEAYSTLAECSFSVCKGEGTKMVTLSKAPKLTMDDKPTCEGSSVTLEATDSESATIASYSWEKSTDDGATWTAMSETTKSISVSPSVTTMYRTTWTTAGGCFDVATATVTVSPKPSVADKTYTICSGTPFTFAPETGDNVPDGTVYSWSVTQTTGVTGASACTNVDALSQTLSNSTAADGTATYTVTPSLPGGCDGDPFTVTVTVKPIPYLTDKTYTICSGTAFTLEPKTGDIVPTGTKYSWTVDDNTNVTGESPQVAPMATMSQILTNTSEVQQVVNYTVTPAYSITTPALTCTGDPFAVAVTVNAVPTVDYAVPTGDVCPGSTVTLIATAAHGVEPYTYEWTGATAHTADHSMADVTASTNCTGTVDVSLRVKDNANCWSLPVAKVVTTKDETAPVISGTIAAQAPVATGTACVFNYPDVRELVRAISTDACTANADLTVTQSPEQGTPIADVSTTNTITVTVKDACNQSSTFDVTVSSVDPVTLTVTDPAAVCQPNTVDLATTYTAETGFTYTYHSDAAGTVAIASPIVSASNTYYIKKTQTATGCFVVEPVTVTIKDKPTVTVTPAAAVCATEPVDLTATVSTTAANPSWTYFTDAAGTIPASVTTITWDATALDQTADQTTTIYAVATSDGCSSDPTATTATLKHRPAAPGVEGITACPKTTSEMKSWASLVKNTETGAELTWYDGSSVVTPADFDLSVALTKSYDVTQTVNGCESEPSTVTVAISNTPSDPDVEDLTQCVVASGTPIAWSTRVNTAGDQTWYSVAEGGTPMTPPAIDVTAVGTTTYYVTVTDGSGCVSNRVPVTATINPTPFIENKEYTICTGQAFTYAPVAGDVVPTGTTYTWTVVDNANVTGESAETTPSEAVSQTLTNNTAAAENVIYNVVPKVGDCTGAAFTVTVTVNPKPAIANKEYTICTGTSVPFDVSSDVVPTGTKYTWTIATDNTNVSGQSTGTDENTFAQTLTNNTATAQSVVYTVTPAGDCTGDNFTVTVNVSPKPSIGNKEYTICTGASVPFDVSSDVVPAGTKYTWTIATDNANVTGKSTGTDENTFAQTLTNATAETQSIVYTVTPAGDCTGDDFTVTVNVTPKPSIANKTYEINSGTPFTYAPIAGDVVPAGTEYTWTVEDNANVTGEAPETTGSTTMSQTLTNTSNADQVVVYTVTPANGTCDGPTFTVTVTVKPSSAISNKVYTICSGTAFTFATETGDMVPDGTKYTWTVATNDNVTGKSAQTTPSETMSQTLTNITNEVQDVIYTVTPISDQAGETFTVTVHVNPVPSITNKTYSICSGAPFTYASAAGDIVPAGIEYTWTVEDNANVTGEAPETAGATALSQTLTSTATVPTNVVYTVTPKTTSCTGLPFTVTVTVNPKPVVDYAVPTGDVCPGSPVTLTPTVTVGTAPYTYTWTGATLKNAAGEADVTASTDCDGTVDVSLTVTDDAGCSSLPVAKVVTTKDETKPVIDGTIAAQEPVATGTGCVFNYPDVRDLVRAISTDACTANANLTVTQSPEQGSAIANVGVENTITVTVKDACDNAQTFDVTVSSIAPVTFTPSTPAAVCAPSTVDLTTTVTPETGYTYAYYSDAAGTVALASPVISATGTNTYYIKKTQTATGCFAIEPVTVTIKEKPVVDVTPAAAVCATESVDLTSTVSASLGTMSYYTDAACTSPTSVTTISWDALAADQTADQSTTLYVIATADGCPSDIESTTATLKHRPAAPTVEGITACPKTTSEMKSWASLVKNTETGADLTWYDGATVVTPADFDLSVEFTKSYTVTQTVNGCESEPSTVTVAISNTPTDPDVDNLTQCAVASGTPIAWSTRVTTAGTQTWYSVAEGGTPMTPPAIDVTAVGTTTYYVTVTDGSGCVSNRVPVTATINPTPFIENKEYTICTGQAFTYAPVAGDVVPTGTTYTWTVVDNANVTGESAETTPSEAVSQTLTNNTAAAENVIYNVVPKVGDCTGAAFTVTVTVNPKPAIANKEYTICTGNPFTFATIASDVVPANTEYTWTVADNNNVSGQSAQTTATGTMSQTLTNNTATAQSVVYTVTPAGDCTGDNFTVTVTVNPKPAIANKEYTICTGNPFTFATIASDVVPANTEYTWTVADNNNVSGQSAQTTGVAEAAMTQTLVNGTNVPQDVVYTVTPKSGDCVGDNFTVKVTVNPMPAIGNKEYTICSGEPFTFATIASDVVPTGIKYTWTVAANANVTGQSEQTTATDAMSQTLTNVTAAAQDVVYTVTPVGTCPGADFTVTVTVNPKAKIADQTYTICTGDAVPFATVDGTDVVPTGTKYTWTIATDNANVTGKSTGTDENAFAQTLNNATAEAQTIVYNVTPKSGDCTGDNFTVTVTVNPKAKIADQTYTICTGDAVPFATVDGTDVVPTGTKYTWTIATDNANVTGKSTGTDENAFAQTLSNATATAQTLTYTVTPMSGTCQGDNFTVTVTVNPKAAIADKTATICTGETATIDVSGDVVPTGTKYTWTIATDNADVTGKSTGADQDAFAQTLSNATATAQTIVYNVTPKSGDCTGDDFKVTVTVNPKPAIANKEYTICTGNPFTFATVASDVVPANTKYTWTVAANANVSGQSDQITAADVMSQTLTNGTDVPQDVIYTVTPAGDCTGSNFTVKVTVNPMPAISNKTYTICSGDKFTYATEDGDVVPTGIKYTWTVAANDNVTGQSEQNTATETMSQTLTNKTNVAQDVVYTVTPAGTCPGAAFTVTVTVNPKAKIANKTYTIRTGEAVPFATVAADVVPANTKYSWTVTTDNANVGGKSAGTEQDAFAQTLTNATATAQTVVYTVTPKSGDCVGDNFTVTVTVKPKPAIANKTYTICSGDPFTYAPVASDVVPAGTTYTWIVVDNTNVDGDAPQGSASTTMSQTLTNNSATAQTVTYTVTPVADGSVGDNFTVTVKVNPKAAIANKTYTRCTGESFTLDVTGDRVPAGTTYTWTVAANANVSGQSAQASATSTMTQTLTNKTNVAQNVVYTVTPKSGDCVGDDFTVTVTVNPKAKVANKTYTICSETPFTFATVASDVVPAGTTYSWTKPVNANVTGQTEVIDATSMSQTLTNSTNTAQKVVYTVTPKSGSCEGDNFTVTVTVNPKPVITVNPAADVCNNLTVDLAATFSSNVSGSTFAYYTDAAGTSPASVTTAKWNASAPNQTVDQTTTLYAIATANTCKSESASSSVTIKHKPVAPTVENIRECAAVTPEAREWASLVSNVEANAELKWYNGSTAVTPADFDMSVAMNKAYSVTQTVNGCESDKSMVEVHIKPLPEAPMVTNNVVCEGVGSKAWRDLVTSRVDGGVKTWFSDINGTAQIAEPITISFSKPGERTAYVAIEKDGCLSEVVEVSSSVHATPSFAEVIDESDESTTLRVNGVAPFTYLLDKNIREQFDGEVNLGILSIGNHPLTVSDEIGCKNDTVLRIEPIPLVPDKFFTPNGDGVNDKWTIKGLERYPETKIFLHDRYGKELAEFKAKDFDGWDGKYNGEDMPSTDYWYIIELRETGKRMVGHFLLRR